MYDVCLTLSVNQSSLRVLISSWVTRAIRFLIALTTEAGAYIEYRGLADVFSHHRNIKVDGRHTAQICIFWVQLDRLSQSCNPWRGLIVEGLMTLH